MPCSFDLAALIPLAVREPRDPTAFIVLLAIGVIVAFASKYLLRRREQDITAAHRLIENELGLTFSATGKEVLLDQWQDRHLFSLGHSKNVTNMFHGEFDEVEIATFDYEYMEGTNRKRRSYRQTVVCFKSELLDLPKFELRPEWCYHKVGSLFGFQDIDLESHPEFSHLYLLRGEDEVRVRKTFDSELAVYLHNERDICAEGEGPHLMFFRWNIRVDPADMPKFISDTRRLMDQFRRYSGN